MTVGEATRQYQNALEAVRQNPDDPALTTEMLATRRQLEVLYYNEKVR